MKTLKFASNLVPLIISGRKTSTWRLFDDKDIVAGDELEFVDRGNGSKFGTATVTTMSTKLMKDVSEADFIEGHERYESMDAFLSTFKSYYGDAVNWDTPVKMIKFSFTPFVK